MTKKDYELIARILRTIEIDSDPEYDERKRSQLACAFAATLASTNPRFDRARFLRACGVEV